MRTRSQFTSPQIAVSRNVDNTTIDKISAVNANIEAIAALGVSNVISDMSTLAGVDFISIQNQVDSLDGLTVSVVETLPAGSQATAELIGNIIQLRIPRGQDGINGIDGANGINGTNGVDGVTPVKGVDYNDGYTPIKGTDYFDGAKGADGVNGKTPILEFTYNQETGDIDYSVIGYEEQ